MSTNITTPYYELPNVILASQIIGYLGGSNVVILNIPQVVLIIKKNQHKMYHYTLFY